MPGAVPWMPRCIWWESSTSRKPHGCSQTQLITKGHHIRHCGFQLSQHSKVVDAYVQIRTCFACVCVFTVGLPPFHSWRIKDKIYEWFSKTQFSQESLEVCFHKAVFTRHCTFSTKTKILHSSVLSSKQASAWQHTIRNTSVMLMWSEENVYHIHHLANIC